MQTEKTYFWDGKQVLEKEDQFTIDDVDGLLDMFCVDMYSEHAEARYGAFCLDTENTEDRGHSVKWYHIPYTMFPKEFKAHLLLLL